MAARAKWLAVGRAELPVRGTFACLSWKDVRGVEARGAAPWNPACSTTESKVTVLAGFAYGVEVVGVWWLDDDDDLDDDTIRGVDVGW